MRRWGLVRASPSSWLPRVPTGSTGAVRPPGPGEVPSWVMPVKKTSMEDLETQLAETNDRLTAPDLDDLTQSELFAYQLELLERIERLRASRRKYETLRW